MTQESKGLYDRSDLDVVDIPRRGGAQTGRPCDTVPLRHIGPHVAAKVASAIEHGEGAAELAWHVGAAKGANLIDAATAKRFDQFVDGMAKASDQKAFFNSEVKPILYNLQPVNRSKGDQ